MFAVLKTGGKQYKVTNGDVLRVEKLAADAGETVQFNEILMVGSKVGAPLVDDAGVQAEVIDQIKGDKVIHFVKRRRKHGSQRTKGHRQQLTLLRVTDILESGAGASGVKAAIGAGGVADKVVKSDGAYAKNKTGEAEMAKRVATGEAKEKPAEKTADAAGDDLTAITGVGPAAVKKLNEAGITTYAQLAAVDPETFEGTKVKPEWVEQAKELAGK
ncbi:50S ribosomal protein L21 [Psychromarinibacter sp. C21-152]|uniref:Large ribosomal subunit protein bL21 n=1 Tax=Psychromarinibacter sediminicola TaxID=3033385 RepID=A0AAE3NQG8_9RHOB|nr:50S ribosomal protein L21 [Psychromarinibacter sediminicola]MDF0600546.1 50S ribosomal protein L21 [Psychromarinibacter sediminicola]